MADYDAKIRISADTKAVESQLIQLERRIKNLQAPNVKSIRNIGEAFVPQQALGKLEKGLSAIANRANTAEKVFARLVEGVGTLSVAGVGLEGLNTALKNVASYTGNTAANFSGAARKIDELAASGDALRTTLAQLNNLLVDVGHGVERVVVPGFAAMDDTAQAAASQANKLQFAMQQFLDSTEGIRTAVNQFGTLDGAAGVAAAALAALAVVAETQLTDALHEVDTVGGVALKQLADDAARGVSELQRLIKATQGTVDQYEKLLNIGRERLRNVSADSDEARRAANTITRAQQLLNAELERQNNLLREAQGLRPQSVENRATNTYNVTQRGKENERIRRNEMAAVEQSIASISQQPTDFTRALGLDVADDKLRRFNAEMAKVQEALRRMETSGASNPFGITAQQIELADHNAKKFASDIDLVNTQLNELVQVHQALGRMESQPRNVFGIELDQVEEVYNMRVKEEAAYEDLRMDTIRRSIDAELDGIDAVFKARNKANTAALKDFDKRLQGRQEIKKTRKQTAENVALGAGFPLLFGGGAGAVLGGAAGGLYQGNPMMSVVTSAIGTLVDQFVTGVLTMGASVNDLIGNFEALKTAMVFVSKEQEHEIKLLIDSGRVQQAANEIQARLIDIVGSDGLQALSEAGRASDELSRTWGEFSLQMQAFVAGPLAAFINQINKTLGNVNQQNKYVQSIQDVNTLYTQLNKEGKTKQANQLVKNVQKAQNVSAAQFMADPATLTANVRQQIDTYKQFLKNKGQEDAKLSAEQRQKQIQNAADLYADLAAAERKHQQDKLQYANQYADMVLSLLRQQEDMDLQLARKAQDIRLQTRQKELEILEQQIKIELDFARNVATQRQLQFEPGEGIAAAVQAAVDEYSISIKEINTSAEVKQKQAKLELIRLDIENERYKFDTAKQIARLNYDNVKQIARINEQINLQNEEAARNNYDLRIGVATAELAAIRAQAISQYTMASAQISPTMPADQRKFYETMKTGMFEVLKDSATMQQKVESGVLFKKPAPLGKMGSLPSIGADFTAVDKANSALKDQLQIQIDLLNKGDTTNKQKAVELQLIKQLRDATISQLDAIIKGQLDQAAYQREYGQLLQKNTLPALADQLAKIEALYKPAKDALDLQIKMTEAAILEAKARGENVDALEKALAVLKEQEGIVNKRKTDATKGAKDAASPGKRLEEKRNEVQAQLNELVDPINTLVTGADAIGTAFSNSFKSIIDGSMTARQALSSFFQSVASAFLDMAAQIIAKWITMTILNSVLALFPGGGGKGGSLGNNFNGASNSLGAGAGLGNFSLGSPFATQAAYAEGGYVTGPTNALIGEGGQSEYVIPSSKMSQAMSNYSAGKRGASILGDSSTTGDSSMGSSGSTFTLETVIINNVEYATVDQVRAMSNAAAKQGAEGGFSKSMSSLRNSRSQRSRLGMR
jgi:hypothetical protein